MKKSSKYDLSSSTGVLATVEYDAPIHCKSVYETTAKTGGIYAFCRKHKISDITFFKWMGKNPEFNEHYRAGLMVARANWEDEGELNHDDETWNFQYWRMMGELRFAVGKSNKVRIEVDYEADPWEQYKQVMRQASYGDLTAADIKQIMESVNVGVRAFEVFKQQVQINELREDCEKAGVVHGGHQVTDKSSQEVDKDSV